MPQKILLDVDPGCDDAAMIAMALGSPAIEVTGITTVAGNSTVDNTTHNALAILELFDRTDIPVARGASGPIVGEVTTAEWVHGPDGIRGDLPNPTTEPVDTHAVEFILQQADTHGQDLAIAAVGPLTNIAAALIQDPALPDRVDEIYVMGGAAMTVGNTTPMAEANIYNDPVAAKRVVGGAAPRLVALDATNRATIAHETIANYADAPAPVDTIAEWLTYPASVRKVGPTDEPAIHDAAVLAHLIDGVLTFESYYLDVDTSDGPCRGAVICDKYGVLEEEPNAAVAIDIDTEAFRSTFTSAIEAL